MKHLLLELLKTISEPNILSVALNQPYLDGTIYALKILWFIYLLFKTYLTYRKLMKRNFFKIVGDIKKVEMKRKFIKFMAPLWSPSTVWF